MWGLYTNIFIISIEALLYSNPLIQLRENNIYNLTQPNTSHTPWTSKRHVILRNIYVIRHDRSDVRGWSLKQLPKLAITTTIAYKTHVLQRFADLQWRQAYLAAEAGDDVGDGEIDGLLVFAGLAVAGVELRYLFGVELVAETGVEKMTDLRIHADIVDVGLPRVVDMIDFKDERRHRPWSYAASWSSRRNTVAVRAAQQVVHKRRLIRALRTKKYENLMVHHLAVLLCAADSQ